MKARTVVKYEKGNDEIELTQHETDDYTLLFKVNGKTVYRVNAETTASLVTMMSTAMLKLLKFFYNENS